jgi:hypothetical protein
MPVTRNELSRFLAWIIALAFCVAGFVWTANLYRRQRTHIRAFHTNDVTAQNAKGETRTAPEYLSFDASGGHFVIQRIRCEKLLDENNRLLNWIPTFDVVARVPIWVILIGWLGLMALVVRRLGVLLRARSARQAGHCPLCGYDLRGTPERCPECGAVPTASRCEHSPSKSSADEPVHGV